MSLGYRRTCSPKSGRNTTDRTPRRHKQSSSASTSYVPATRAAPTHASNAPASADAPPCANRRMQGEITKDAIYIDAERRFAELEKETKKLHEESKK